MKKIAFSLALGLLAVLEACGYRPETSTWQEPVVAWTRTRDGNPVAFGASLPFDDRYWTVAEIASWTHGRLPGVRFYVVKYPAALEGTRGVHSYRVPGPEGLIVLSWWRDAQGNVVVGDIPWEVEHLAAGTRDDGTPWVR